MIDSRTTSCSFGDNLQQALHPHPHPHQAYGIGTEDHPNNMIVSSTSDSLGVRSKSGSEATALLYSLSILKNKVNEVQSLLSIIISPDRFQPFESTSSTAVTSMGTVVQEIIVTASSMMFTCQQMMTSSSITVATNNHSGANPSGHPSMYPETLEWCTDQQDTINNNTYVSTNIRNSAITTTLNDPKREQQALLPQVLGQGSGGLIISQRKHSAGSLAPKNYDIIELDVAELLAKYTHYCQVCGKGFKRDANLRMHMRAHGDEYKCSSAITNPLKKIKIISNDDGDGFNNNNAINVDKSLPMMRKYSCPQEGCRWNQRHAKFQPLRSMICTKNHYKRSHCPKMYVCKECNKKQFSVLSDLRTHEKHCGDLKWQCSCGTTFSRKDKLMSHVALFVGHTPLIHNNNNLAKREGGKIN